MLLRMRRCRVLTFPLNVEFQKLKKWPQKKVKLSNAFNIAIKAALTEIKGGNDEVTLRKSCNILYRLKYVIEGTKTA